MSLERIPPGSHPAAPSRWKHPEADVQETAYYIWEKEGRPSGHEMDHWLRAEQQVRTLRNVDSIRDQNS